MGRRGRTVPHCVQAVWAATLDPAYPMSAVRNVVVGDVCLLPWPSKGRQPSACYPWRSTSYALHRARGRWQLSASVASRLTCCLRTCCRKPARSEASAAVCQCQVVSSTLSRDLWHKVDASHAHNTPTVGSRPYTGFRKVVIGLGTARLLVVACCCYNLQASLESHHYT